MQLDNYLDKVWSCKKIIKSDAPTFSVWTFTSYDSEKSFSLNLGLWYSNCADSMIFALYCPFWMVNKTALSLSYKVRHLNHGTFSNRYIKYYFLKYHITHLGC